jgi:hypothetical protein
MLNIKSEFFNSFVVYIVIKRTQKLGLAVYM